MALHFGGGSVAGEGADGGRQGDAGGAECQAGGGARGGADEEALVVVGDLGLGQRVEIGEDLGPRAGAAERGDALLQLGLQDEGEEGAEDGSPAGWGRAPTPPVPASRMVVSTLWKIGRVASRCLAVRKVASTVQSCL